MFLRFEELLPTDPEPDILVIFDKDEVSSQAQNGMEYDADSEFGIATVLYVSAEAMLSSERLPDDMSTEERFSRVYHQVFRFLREKRFRRLAFEIPEAGEFPGMEDDFQVLKLSVRCIRRESESMDLEDLVLLSYPQGWSVPYSEALAKEIRVFGWNDAIYPFRQHDPYRESAVRSDEAIEFPTFEWNRRTYISFGTKLDQWMDCKEISPGDFLQRANISRQTLSKLRKPDAVPQKYTALACAIALELDIDQTRLLLEHAGYALSPNLKTDVIVAFFIKRKLFDIDIINLALFREGLHQLGARN